ncbi:MAG: PEP-CTERM sorting domain-containing protein [Planctomycetota bacterium]|jgi:hypothetical protein
MKKLLVLVLVLGLASVVRARNTGMALQLSVNGTPAPDEITLMVSDWIMLDILAADGYALDVMELDLEVIGPGHIEIDRQMAPTDRDIIVGCFESWSWLVDGVTDKGIGVIVGMTFNPDGCGGKLVDYILFHADDLGDVVIQITDAGTNNDPVNGDIAQDMMGSIIIHQVPEPTTILLLGLGVLIVRRKGCVF